MGNFFSLQNIAANYSGKQKGGGIRIKDDLFISRLHMKVNIVNGSEIYISNHSKNGSYLKSFVDGKFVWFRMEKNNPYKVVVGSTVYLFDTIKFRILHCDSVVCTGEIDKKY